VLRVKIVLRILRVMKNTKRNLEKRLAKRLRNFLENPCVEELADITEILYAIADFEFGGKAELEKSSSRKS